MTTFGTVVAGGTVVTVVLLLPVPLLDFGSVVAAMTARVVVVVVATVEVEAPLIVVLRLALPWKTERIFFEVLLSRSGRMTEA
jgi:hypothetical protein